MSAPDGGSPGEAPAAASPPTAARTVAHTIERIVSIRHRTPSLVSLTTTRHEDFTFRPGQYARLGLGDEGAVIWRPYSIGSPVDARTLQFEFTRVEGGPFTRHFLGRAPGDRIRVDRRSFGFLTLEQVEAGGALWLVATGTGLAPFVSILADPATLKRHARVIVVHSVRQVAELTLDSIDSAMGRIARSDRARVQVIPVVTRERVDGTLGERLGALLASGELERVARCRIEPGGSRVMLCGNPDMIKDVRAILGERGLVPGRRAAPGQMLTEGYW